jgi:parvulin-like peptidyl-prolyl isomerase
MKKSLAILFCMAAASASAAPLPPETPLIKRGALVVTAQDFEAQMLRIPEPLRSETRGSLERVATMTDSLFVNRALALEAREKGFLADPLVELRGRQVLESYQARAYLDHLEKTQAYPDFSQRAREIYLADRAKYQVPPTFNVDHILVNLWGRTREMALERIREAQAKIAGGADFLAVAKEYSTDPGLKQNQGRLGTVTPADIDSEISQVLPTLKDGEVSKPILTRSGYHLVRVTARTPGRQRTFEEVREAIVEEEKAKVLKRVAEERLRALRNDPETRIDTEALKKLVHEIPRGEIKDVHRGTERR